MWLGSQVKYEILASKMSIESPSYPCIMEIYASKCKHCFGEIVIRILRNEVKKERISIWINKNGRKAMGSKTRLYQGNQKNLLHAFNLH